LRHEERAPNLYRSKESASHDNSPAWAETQEPVSIPHESVTRCTASPAGVERGGSPPLDFLRTDSILTAYAQTRRKEMPRKIFRAGNSAVVSLPPEVMEITDLELGDEVETADPERNQIVITTATLSGVRPGFLERVDRFIDRYRPALDTLASE
jgi:putative addiction module antidote